MKMLQSFVGTITRRGLESFYLEHEHTARFVQRRAARRPHREMLCFWAVICDEGAIRVRSELAAGSPRNALFVLQTLAREMGSYVPDESCLVDPSVGCGG